MVLLLGLPATWQFRSPGGVNAMWYLCTVWALGCLALGLVGMVRASGRSLGRYVVCGPVTLASLLALGNLANTAHEQNQFDRWAHRGISSYSQED